MDSPFMPQHVTWIDKRGKQRIVPMEVLCLGLYRTGTTSLRVALMELGYNVYHGGVECFSNPPDSILAKEAIEAKLRGQPWGRKEFDWLYFDRNAIADVPIAIYAQELTTAYPEAKVILTVRDPDAWHRSCSKTVCGKASEPSWLSNLAFRLDPVLGTIFDCLMLYGRAFARRADFWNTTAEESRITWDQHLENVRSLVPKDRLLEYRITEGWLPLCRFLDKPIPKDLTGQVKPFPSVNEAANFNAHFDSRFRWIFLKALLQYGGAVAVVILAIFVARSISS